MLQCSRSAASIGNGAVSRSSTEKYYASLNQRPCRLNIRAAMQHAVSLLQLLCSNDPKWQFTLGSRTSCACGTHAHHCSSWYFFFSFSTVFGSCHLKQSECIVLLFSNYKLDSLRASSESLHSSPNKPTPCLRLRPSKQALFANSLPLF